MKTAAAGKAGLWEGCLSLFYELHERGLPPDPGAYTALLKALRTAGRLDALRSFLGAVLFLFVSLGGGGGPLVGMVVVYWAASPLLWRR